MNSFGNGNNIKNICTFVYFKFLRKLSEGCSLFTAYSKDYEHFMV